ncbi:MAG: phenylalanine--tRNA ligase subunit alpha [Bacteroidetes Order II. Incertae sedis bacterium]|nr:phenylalanine--tRNA ligase subunit alpha [Bacteroidetes Order II. bacterium]
MISSLAALESQIQAEDLHDAASVEAFRIKYLGRKNGLLTDLFGQIGKIAPEERKTYGAAVNTLKQQVEARLAAAQALVEAAQKQAVAQTIDLTLPGRMQPVGGLHPIRQTMEEIKRIFLSFGFGVAEGPEIEEDWYNFSALNFPPDHPARDMQDTFFVESPNNENGGVVLRTHTSPVQVRTMQSTHPPIRIIAPGRVYRNETITYKSYCLFHQVEGLYVDQQVTFADLKQVLRMFAEAAFGAGVKMRFRPSFFPFTEPSAEVDIWWQNEDGSGRWLEILGCGMVDPNVLENCGIDSEKYTGYAFGMGVERIAMLRHGITDIRVLYENDLRFLEQF